MPSLEVGFGGTDSFKERFGKTLSTYSLPLTSDTADKLAVEEPTTTHIVSPAPVARDGTDAPVSNTPLLASPMPQSGVNELVKELGWMANFISGRAA